MTIISRPSTKEYRDGWNRVFGERRRHQIFTEYKEGNMNERETVSSLEIKRDEVNEDTITIYGVRYQLEFFRNLAAAPAGSCLVCVEKTSDGVILLHKCEQKDGVAE